MNFTIGSFRNRQMAVVHFRFHLTEDLIKFLTDFRQLSDSFRFNWTIRSKHLVEYEARNNNLPSESEHRIKKSILRSSEHSFKGPAPWEGNFRVPSTLTCSRLSLSVWRCKWHESCSKIYNAQRTAFVSRILSRARHPPVHEQDVYLHVLQNCRERECSERWLNFYGNTLGLSDLLTKHGQ